MGNSAGKGAAKATVGRPKATKVGRVAPGNFTFTSSKTGSGFPGASANTGFLPGGPKKKGGKKGK
jgi:hypothetical protein